MLLTECAELNTLHKFKVVCGVQRLCTCTHILVLCPEEGLGIRLVYICSNVMCVCIYYVRFEKMQICMTIYTIHDDQFSVLGKLLPTEIFQPGSSRRGSLQENPLYVFEG